MTQTLTQTLNYDNNIQLIRNVLDGSINNPPRAELPEGQYYALMVVDDIVRDRGGNKYRDDTRQFFNQKSLSRYKPRLQSCTPGRSSPLSTSAITAIVGKRGLCPWPIQASATS